MEIKPGKYQHFKGKFYTVIGVGRNSETLEEMVVYQAEYNDPKFGNKAIWIRPKTMFLEEVEHEGKKVKRFTFLG